MTELDEAKKKVPESNVAGGQAGMQLPFTDEQALAALRELVRQRVREVVRKKAGGGGYALYAPNKGKKGKPRAVGTFPTKLGAKRAELARFPPKDPGKLKRLRKEVDRLIKNPKKAADKEKTARKEKGTDKGAKKEGVIYEAGTPFSPTKPGAVGAMQPAPSSGETRKDVASFLAGLKTLQKGSPDYNKYVNNHGKLLNPGGPDNDFRKDVQKHDKTLAAAGKPTLTALLTGAGNSRSNAGFKPGQTKVTAEAVERRMDFMERKIISKIVTKSLTESLFREETTESEWDEYIGKLSKNALNGDGKFQKLQKNISKRTESALEDSLSSIKKALGKDIKLKSFGVKHDPEAGTYLPFSVSFDDITAEPIIIHVEGGVPKINLSSNAKVALTKADPQKAKMLRAELVTVQERVLDNMDDLARAIQARDNYLSKLESEVDGYIAGLSPLQVSLLKQLLVKKYRKIS